MKVEKNNTYIKVPHSMFFHDKDTNGTEIHKIGTQGFALWAYLLMLQGANNILPITIDYISNKINVSGLKDKTVVKNILINLRRLENIKCDPLENIRPKELIFISIPKYDEDGYSTINTQLIVDYLHKIGHVAFTLYCLMYKEHNRSNGNPESNGYCQRLTSWFADRLGIARKTVEIHIKKLPNKLVTVKEMPPMQDYNVKGELIYTQQPSRYYVHAKYEIDNIYYIEHNTQEKKKKKK